MNVDKVAARATNLAKQLGVQFTPPSFEESEVKAQTRMKKMAEYRSRKAEYDSFIEETFSKYSKDVIIAFIEATKNPK